MKTFIINNEKDLEKYKDDFGYHIDGNAEFNYSADFAGRLLVDGYLYIEAGWSIKAGGYIKAGGSIEAGGYIEAGWYYGISAGLQITCRETLSFGLKAYVGICAWRDISEEEKTITCSKLLNGTIEYGILKETGEAEDNATQEAIKLLEDNGYKIVKE